MLPQILNIPESSWHILTPFRTFLSGQAAFLPRPWMLRMGVRQQKVYGSQAGLDCRMILDDLGCFDSTVVSCVLHHIALYCILLLLVWHIFQSIRSLCMILHVFACICIFLQSFGFFGVRWSLTVQLWLPADLKRCFGFSSCPCLLGLLWVCMTMWPRAFARQNGSMPVLLGPILTFIARTGKAPAYTNAWTCSPTASGWPVPLHAMQSKQLLLI